MIYINFKLHCLLKTIRLLDDLQPIHNPGRNLLVIVDRGFLTSPILQTPSKLLIPLILIFSNLPNVLFYLIIWWTYTWHVSTKSTLLSVMQQGVKVTVGLTQMTWLLPALLFHIAHTNKYTQIWHINIYNTNCYVFAAAICVILNESLNDIKNSFYRGQQYLCFSKITHLQKLSPSR